MGDSSRPTELLGELRNHCTSCLTSTTLHTTPSNDAIAVVQILSELEAYHSDVVQTLMLSLKNLDGNIIPSAVTDFVNEPPLTDDENSQANMTLIKLKHLIDPLDPFSPQLSLTGFRNWFRLINSLVIVAQGSEAKLKFRYWLLPPLTVVIFHAPLWHPEFCPRLYDYIEAWKKRLTYDSTTIEILMSAFRGDGSAVEKSVGHTNAQIASHFMALRQEALSGTGPSVQESSALPSYMMSVMEELKSIGESGSNEASEWFKTRVGDEVLKNICDRRREIEERYGPMLMRFKGFNVAGESEGHGQILALLRREFAMRCALMKDETTMLAMLDSRHEYLKTKYDYFHHARTLLQEHQQLTADEQNETTTT